MNNLLPFMDKIHPPEFVQFISHAWNNFVWANGEFVKFFVRNDYIDIFIQYIQANLSQNQDLFNISSDTLDIIEGILLFDHNFIEYFMNHSILDVITMIFNNFTKEERSNHYSLISLLISINEELAMYFISQDFHKLVIEDGKFSVRQISSRLTLAIDFLNNCESHKDILLTLRDIGFYEFIVSNISILGEKDFKYALNALLTISRLPQDDIYFAKLKDMSENSELMQWIEELRLSDSLEVESLAQILDQIIASANSNNNDL